MLVSMLMANLGLVFCVTSEETTASDMQDQLDTEGLENLMLADNSTLAHAIGAEGLRRPRGCDACAPPIATLLKGPLLAAYARLATPWGAGRNIVVLGTLGKFLAGTGTAMRVLLVVNVMKWEGRMRGWGTPRHSDLAARPPHNYFLAIVDAAAMSKGSRDASVFAPLEPAHATMGGPQKDRSPGTCPLAASWRRPHRRQLGCRHPPGCTSRAKALWAMASGSKSRNGKLPKLHRDKTGTSVHQLVGSSRCLGASAASLRGRRQLRQRRLRRRQVPGGAKRAAAAAAPGTRTPTC